MSTTHQYNFPGHNWQLSFNYNLFLCINLQFKPMLYFEKKILAIAQICTVECIHLWRLVLFVIPLIYSRKDNLLSFQYLPEYLCNFAIMLLQKLFKFSIIKHQMLTFFTQLMYNSRMWFDRCPQLGFAPLHHLDHGLEQSRRRVWKSGRA